MKKFARIALTACLLLGIAAQANAVDFKIKGRWISLFDYGQNGNMTGGNGSTGYAKGFDNFEALQRWRIQLDAVASENLSGTVHFEIGKHRWGQASTGGQLMPPVMGAAAFLMAEFVGVPYIEVVKAAVIPALLYYTGIWLSVHYEAKKYGLKGTPRDQLPKFGPLLREKGHLAVPLIVIVYLLVSGYTPMRAALYAIGLTIVCACMRKNTRITFAQFINGLVEGSQSVLGVLIACASAGIIIGVVTKTGVGLKLATALLDLAQGKMIPAMFFTMITSLILGMGVPTTANYVITSTIAAPALVQMKVPVLAAHMFAFYFGIVADVTPPVALAAYAGSGIAGSNPMKTGVTAAKLAIAAFVVPYIFVLAPQLLMINATVPMILMAMVTAIIGMWGLSLAMIGFCQHPLTALQRIAFFIGGLCLIIPGSMTDIAGIGILVLCYLWQKKNPGGPLPNVGD